MISWLYRIQATNGCIWTTNTDYAEEKSKVGYRVFCYRTSNRYVHHS